MRHAVPLTGAFHTFHHWFVCWFIYMCETQIFTSKLHLWYYVRFILETNNLVLKVYRHLWEVSIFITQHTIQFVLQKVLVYLLCDFFWERNASFMLGKYFFKIQTTRWNCWNGHRSSLILKFSSTALFKSYKDCGTDKINYLCGY